MGLDLAIALFGVKSVDEQLSIYIVRTAIALPPECFRITPRTGWIYKNILCNFQIGMLRRIFLHILLKDGCDACAEFIFGLGRTYRLAARI